MRARSPRLTPGRPTGRLAAVLFALLLVLGLGVVPATSLAASGDAAGPPSQGGSGDGSAAGAGATHRVTLLTGDVVVLHTAPGGHQTAWIAKPATPPDRGVPPEIYQLDGQVHVIPAEAAPYVTSGALDANLFNVSLLVQQGYSDEARHDLPLLVQAKGGPSATHTPAVPSGARKIRELDSIATVSVDAPKRQIRSVWESLRGQHAAAYDADDAHLAAAGKVWLNGMAHATLEDSVPQIGAPEAWAAGFDGEGVDVAVLDTGYDPTHPDLAGKVTRERNFTPQEDPPGQTAVDGNGHGTHVAATIAGSGAASDGRRKGVAPGAHLWIGKVLNDSGDGPLDQIITGMQWAADSGADVVNMSLGTPWVSDGTDPLSEAVDQLTESSGALFVVAAGNSGPAEQTVTAPGSADLALTVGAVTKQDGAAWFSSRGPRWGDLAIKPEIVAPGVDIVAARADGTSLGNLVDKYYTSLSGTSMATPHVAGSAAILAQEHPGWDADELKARLVATSKTLTDEPVTFQGGGRVDVAAAVRDTITVDDAVLSMGRIAQESEPVTRTLTYANPNDEAVRLRLSTDVHGTGVDRDHKPQLTFDRDVLVVPARGTSSVRLTLAPQQTASGRYAGDLVAQVVGHPDTAVHSVVSFAVAGPLRTVTVNAVNRDGEPATGPVDLWNEDTGDYQRLWMNDGTASGRLPDGSYTLVTTIQDTRFWATNQAVAADPEFDVHGDVTVSYDARNAVPVDVTTPQEADLESFQVMWSRSVGGHTFSTSAGSGRYGQHLYLIPSGKARRGSFRFVTQWQFVQPMLTARIGGPDGDRLRSNPQFASLGDPFVGDASLPVVYADAGTPEDFATVDAADKIALVTRNGDLWSQVQAAKDEGVALLLVQNNQTGFWPATVWGQGLPTYRLDQGAGEQIRQALAQNPDLTLSVSGLQDPTYNYELAFPEPRIPIKPTYDVNAESLATVVSDYRQNSERMSTNESWIPFVDSTLIGNAMRMGRNGPVVRTEYVTATPGVTWERLGQPDIFADMYWTWSPPKQYQPGETDHQLWWGPLVHPAVVPLPGAEASGAPVARFRDAIRILMPHYSYGGTLYGFIQNQLGDRSELTLRRNGEVIGKSAWSVAQFLVPAERSEYELTLLVSNGEGNFADTSVRTESTWRFESARSTDARTVLPLVQLRYDLDTNRYNEVASGHSYPLFLTPGYQPGATGPGAFSATVEVSYDGGQTWVDAPVDSVDGRLRATVPSAPGAGFASVRVEATDAAGNALTQEIDKAWKTAP
ncbi:MAG TPA: S8 family serine peptidase [Nocardioidaceae bacterium]|jgi:subtilisin family serine protease